MDMRKALPPYAVILFFILGSLQGLTINSEAFAQTFTTWPDIVLTKYAGGLSQPTHITHAGDGSGRLFVVEQRGRVRVIKDGALQAAPFLDITGRVSCCGEQGLLSVAFPPGYTSKGYFYVDYTDLAGDTIVARYRIINPDMADPATEEVLLKIDQPFSNHNGGQLLFGPDGYLYIGMGDGGSGGDPYNNAQNPSSLLGKILRIDVESGVKPYAIPPGNPFVGAPGYRAEIWALGLRNPWRFSFDRGTDDLFIADVGQNLYEEIDYQPASSGGGENYGWRIMEGLHCYNQNQCDKAGLVLPVAEYDHSLGCSVTGGMVYRGRDFPGIQETYLYGDFCSGKIWGLKREGGSWRNELLIGTAYEISTFGEDEDGELYLSDYSIGDIYRVTEDTKGGGGGCVVAVAYGTDVHPHVKAIQMFRDKYLLRLPFGRVFARFYYQHSPEAAEFISRHGFLRPAARWLLTSIVYVIEYPYIIGIILLGFIVMLRKRSAVFRVGAF